MENFFLWAGGGGAVCTAHSRLSSTRRNASHASTATATASLYFLSAWYCSAPPPFFIFLHRPSWPPRSQCPRWQASLQYLVLHLLHLFLWSWASGAAQAAQFVRIIVNICASYRAARSVQLPLL